MPYVITERGRDVSGNTPVLAVYGIWDTVEDADEYRAEKVASSGDDKIYDTEELIEVPKVTPLARKNSADKDDEPVIATHSSTAKK